MCTSSGVRECGIDARTELTGSYHHDTLASCGCGPAYAGMLAWPSESAGESLSFVMLENCVVARVSIESTV